MIDADGGTVMPGIQDGHMRPLGTAAQSLNPSPGKAGMTAPRLRGSAVPRFRARLQEMPDASAAQEPDGWLQVPDWNPVGLLPADGPSRVGAAHGRGGRRPDTG